MITYHHGSIFDSTAQTITNPVNVVGVAGRGLARQFKLRYPLAHDYYAEVCYDVGPALLGRPFLFRFHEYPKRILFFPTKNHWRDPSEIGWIKDGLQYLAANYERMGIASLALPALGSGLGGLDFAEVHEHMIGYLGGLPIPIEVYLPQDSEQGRPDELHDGQFAWS